jgi:hypothetical protein
MPAVACRGCAVRSKQVRFTMDSIGAAIRILFVRSSPTSGGLICHTPQPTPPIDDDDDDEDEKDDRGSGGGNIDPDDDEGGSDDDDDDDDDDTLWT